MKTLLLLRHARAKRDDPTLDDFDRPLTKRGDDAAARMGGYLCREIGKPDLTLCSAALRTRQTFDRVAAAFEDGLDARTLKGLYLAAPSRLLAGIRRTPDNVDCLMVVGHNPGIETLAAQLCGGGRSAALQRMARKFPTGALAEIRFDIERWAEAAAGGGQLRNFVVPRDL